MNDTDLDELRSAVEAKLSTDGPDKRGDIVLAYIDVGASVRSRNGQFGSVRQRYEARLRLDYLDDIVVH